MATTLDKVWLLESSGSPVADTTVTFAAAAGRTVVMRHAQDEAIFLILEFPPSTDTTGIRDSVHVAIHPTPAKYGFTISMPDNPRSGAHATFSYAIHFLTPADAATKYPSPGRFEQLLAPASLGADEKVQLLPNDRPGADMIRFAVTAAGTYGLVVVR